MKPEGVSFAATLMRCKNLLFVDRFPGKQFALHFFIPKKIFKEMMRQ